VNERAYVQQRAVDLVVHALHDLFQG
jgi:hypothetical protein